MLGISFYVCGLLVNIWVYEGKCKEMLFLNLIAGIMEKKRSSSDVGLSHGRGGDLVKK